MTVNSYPHPSYIAAIRAIEAGDLALARRCFAAALTSLADDDRFLTHYADFARSIGDPALASSLYSKAIAATPGDAPPLRLRHALAVMEVGQLLHAIALLQALTRDHPQSVLAWQALGAALRDADRMEEACMAFDRVLRIEPTNPLGRLSRAQIESDLGEPALVAFVDAVAVAATNPAALLGLAAAQAASGDPDKAMAMLEEILARDAGWADGWAALASLVHRWEGRAASVAVMNRAIRAAPGAPAVALAMLRTMTAVGEHDAVLENLPGVRRTLGNISPLALIEAQAASEMGAIARADEVFARLDGIDDPVVLLARMRHSLKAGRPDIAVTIGVPMMSGPAARFAVPYLCTAWRQLDDPRHAWLEGDPRLVGVYDLGLGNADLATLGEELRTLHTARHPPFEQSMRGGTQTEGVLLARRSPGIQRLRGALNAAIRMHIDQLPPADPGHPTLSVPRDDFRFSGSWSVRLSGGGRHVNHVHSEGWFSSACYIALPPAMTLATDEEAGWLVLGQPPEELGLDLAPVRTIRPIAGQVVLFPSTMWHGTRAAPAGERLSVAFDIQPLT